jgi:antitoxin component of RelBE/YafQ-DinJ toxin-antitoxin module
VNKKGYIYDREIFMVQMTVSVDENVINDIEKLYNNLGMNINTAVNMFFQQCLMEKCLPFQQNQVLHGRRHIPLKERLKDYNGDYKTEEWDTGEPMGREVF